MPDMSPAPAPQPIATQPLPMTASPEQFGAGVFGDIAQGAAEANARLEIGRELDLKNQYDAQLGGAQVALAQFQSRMNDAENAARTSPDIPANGYRAAVLKQYDDMAPSVLGGISNPRVAELAKRQMAEMRAHYDQSAADYQTVTLAKMAGQNAAQADDANTALAGQMTDPAAVHQLQQRAADMWHSMADLTQDQRHLGTIQSGEKIGVAYAWGAIQRDPQGALAAIDNGTMTALGVPGDQIHVLRRAAEAGIRGLQAEQRVQMAAAKADFNQRYSLFMARAHDGEDISPRDAAALAREAAVYGEPAKAHDIGRALEDQGFARQYRTMAANPAAMQQHIAELAAKPHPSAEDQRELAWAQEHAGGLASRFTGDPVGYLASFGPRGTQPPPLDMTNPQSIAARAQWAQAASTVAGQAIPPLSDAEMQPLRQRIAQGPSGRLEALSQLDSLHPVARAQWARAIMPNDKLFQQEAQVSPGARATIQAGREAEKGNPQYWPTTNPKDAAQARSARQLANYDAMLAFAMKGMDPADVRAAQQNMRNYIAGRASGAGKANAHSIGASDLKEAVAYALGGQIKDGRQYGGIAQWSGPQSFVVVPETMTAGQFGAAIVNDRAAQDRAGNGPVNPNGSPFDLKRATPVLVGDGLYRWETASGVVMNAKGQPYVSRIGGR